MRNDQQIYESQEFQTSFEDSYVSKVQRNFIIEYETMSYDRIEVSLNEMRDMMKTVSKALDQKIHKYYGLMGVKNYPQQNNKNLLIQKLNNQKVTNLKLIQAQLRQIKEIQSVEKQISSNKRVQKQAQRLRQYFQTKKAMIQADKQTRFSQGQISKAAQYLARDLDIDRHHFRLNKIKQDLQYALLRDRQIRKKNDELQKNLQQMQHKYTDISKIYDKKMTLALKSQLLLPENKQIYSKYLTKKQLFNKKQQILKKIHISNYNIQKSIQTLTIDVQQLKKANNKHDIMIISSQNQINSTENQIKSTKQKTDLYSKLSRSVFLKNIDSLIKNTKIISSTTSIQKNQKFHKNSYSARSSNQPTQISVIMKPNFKIKRSKTKLNPFKLTNKSLDFQRKQQKVTENMRISQLCGSKVLSKRILKWQTSHNNKVNAHIEINFNSYNQLNPEKKYLNKNQKKNQF